MLKSDAGGLGNIHQLWICFGALERSVLARLGLFVSDCFGRSRGMRFCYDRGPVALYKLRESTSREELRAV